MQDQKQGNRNKRKQLSEQTIEQKQETAGKSIAKLVSPDEK